MGVELTRLLPTQPAAQESRAESGDTLETGGPRPPATRWLMQPRLVLVKEALRAVPPSDLDNGEDALVRRDRGHEHSVLHIQQLQAASDGAARVPRWSIRLRNYGATIVCVM